MSSFPWPWPDGEVEEDLFSLGNGPVHVDKIFAQCNGNYSTGSNPLKVTILANDWEFKLKNTIQDELARQLAKSHLVKVTVLVPENSSCEKSKREAQTNGITIVEAKRRPGFSDTESLNFPPADLSTDIVVGYGKQLGKIAQYWKEQHHCKSIHIISDSYSDWLNMIDEHLNKLSLFKETRNELCQVADLPVAIGPKTTDELSASLRSHKKEVFNLTPGIISHFCTVNHALVDGRKFRVLLVGGDNPDNFKKEGLDIAAKAIKELNDKSYYLVYVGAGKGTEEQFAEHFKKCGVAKTQLSIRSLPKGEEEWKSLFCEVDLAIMPSGEKEFGSDALLALSAGLPILVHGDSGFGEALKGVNNGTSVIVDSDDDTVWAAEIKKVRTTIRKQRLKQAALLRSQYDIKYSWEKQCGCLVGMMLGIVCGLKVSDD